MPTLVSFNGTNYNIPLAGETGWGDQVSAFLIAVAGAALVSGSTVADLTITNLNTSTETLDSVAQVLAAAGTVTPSSTNVLISALSAITLSTATAISDGTTEGQLLIITNTGTFAIRIQDAANTAQNGDVNLLQGESIEYKWNATLKWVEQRRSN